MKWDTGATIGLGLILVQAGCLVAIAQLYQYERLDRAWAMALSGLVVAVGWPVTAYAYRRGLREGGPAAMERALPSGERAEPTVRPPAEKAAEKKPAAKPPQRAPARSEALTLLAAMQREARFVDFVQEPIEGYSDAQVGAAVREVHRQCAALLSRAFSLQQVVPEEEGSDVEVPQDFDAARFRLTGNVVGQPPYHGRLVHPGWEASKCELPTWSGTADSARIVAPAEVEVK